MLRAGAGAVAAAWLLCACGGATTGSNDSGADGPEEGAVPVAAPAVENQSVPGTSASALAGLSDAAAAQVRAARDDLADHLGTADIELISHENVTWPNGALGCPKPGMMYTQALQPGYRIVLRAAGNTWSYHGRRGGAPGRCERPQPGAGGPATH